MTEYLDRAGEGDGFGPRADRLDGWKAISDHLGVAEKTAKRWEKSRGLPVRRIKAGGRPQVFAFPAEIADWWSALEAESATPSSTIRGGRAGRWLGAVTVVVVGVSLAVALSRPRAPARVHGIDYLRESEIGQARYLDLLDAGGRVIERRSFDNDVVSAAVAEVEGGDQLILVGFGEGRPFREGRVVAFDRTWQERWQFDSYDPTRLNAARESGYSVSHFLRVTDLRPTLLDGTPVVVAIAQDQTWFASRIALLDLGSGNKVADYWVAGKVGYGISRIVDLDGDGDTELLVAGFHNGLIGELVHNDGDSAVVFALDLEELRDWDAAQIWPARWTSLPVRMPLWYWLIPAVPEEAGTISYFLLEDPARSGGARLAAVTAEKRHYYFTGGGDLVSAVAGQDWYSRWGLRRELPQPIRLGHFGAALSDCWRRRPESAAVFLAEARKRREILGEQAALWRRRCDALATGGRDDDAGVVLERVWARPPVVAATEPESAAALGGLLPGDVVVSFNGVPVHDGNDLRYRVRSTPPAEAITFMVERGDELLRVVLGGDRDHVPAREAGHSP